MIELTIIFLVIIASMKIMDSLDSNNEWFKYWSIFIFYLVALYLLVS